jgi:hypothetical protein
MSNKEPKNEEGWYAALAFHNHGHRFPAAQTERSQSGLAVLADHFVEQGHQHPAAAGADGVAQGHGCRR